MTLTPFRRDLPLLTTAPQAPRGPHGSRSAMTCHYRCDDACSRPEPNTSGNEHVQDVIGGVLARRAVLKGTAVGTGALVLGGLASQAPAAAAPVRGKQPVAAKLGRTTFRPVAPNKRDAVVVPDGWRSETVIRWGDPVLPGAPAFDVANQTREAAEKQFGYNCDYVGLIPLPADNLDRKRDRGVLVVNHEYTDGALMFPAGFDATTAKAVEIANHGMSVITVQRGATPGSWKRVAPGATRYNRRLHATTPFRLTGPAAGSDRLKTSADASGTRVLGTLNNCAGGLTPWGTVLSGEENFNQYFEKSGEVPAENEASYARYGIGGGSRGWAEVEPRFDLTQEPNEPFRFGWIVEVDPLEPGSTPVKHTMLGRMKHEGANIAVDPSGRVVAYMGDDERGDYLYKFVSADTMRTGSSKRDRAFNKRLLEKGTLYVAKVTGDGAEDGVFDGTGEWIALADHTQSFVDGMSLADVLIDTRIAADKVGATRMDRPEDVEPHPTNGRVYAAMTNNSQRGTRFPADEANPITTSKVRPALGAPLADASGNRNGYVLELVPTDNHRGTRFTWNLLLVCGDPEAPETYFGGFDKSQVSPISCPDNVAFDRSGNLWVSTDGNVLGSNDGVFRVPLSGAERGRVQQFATVPRGAEACGPFITDDELSLFIAVQHPGEVDGATFEAPASTWPHSDDFPRPSVVVVHKDR